MLEYLHIRNLALIEDMSLEFSNGINVLTGETGAGKSFILKALGFVLGDKLGADIVRPGAERAQVEALFSLDGKEYVLRRELAAVSGRSRFHINDILSSQEALRELRPRLLSHTSQHAQQQLLQPAFQAALLESGFSEPELLKEKNDILEKIKQLNMKIEEIQTKQGALADKRELLEMQNSEIEKISPGEGEEEELEEIRAEIKSYEGAKQNYGKAMAILHGDDGPGLLELLSEFERLLSHMSHDDEALRPEMENVSAFRQQISHLSNQFRRPPQYSHKVDMDAIEARLFAFAQLKRKLKRSMPQILALKNEIKDTLSFLDVCALDLSHFKKEKNKLEQDLKNIIEKIKPLRRKAALSFCGMLEEQLKDLGFSEHIRVVSEFAPQEILPGVEDERGRIFWAPNPGQNPQPLDRIASGGELSRFLLGLTTVKKQDKNLTYIFDEVDAGVGGLTLNKVGEKLRTLGKEHQVILITHWPQLAAKAEKHFQITKTVREGQTFTQCEPLEGITRQQELERMAGGGKQGKALAQNLFG